MTNNNENNAKTGVLEPEIVDAHALDSLLKTFGFTTEGKVDREKFCAWLDSEGGFLHGKALLDKMFDKHADEIGLNGQNRETLRQLFDFASAPDEGLGCISRPWRDAYVEALQTYHTHQPKANDAVVQLDFRNMASTNEALGRQQVSRIMRVMTKIFETALCGNQQEIDKITALTRQDVSYTDPGRRHTDREIRHKPWQQRGQEDDPRKPEERRQEDSQATVIRPGGDEVEFEVSGLRDGMLRGRISRALAATDSFLAHIGTVGRGVHARDELARLEYKKNPGDRERTGFGVGAGLVMLEDTPKTMPEIQEGLDKEIKDSKEEQGKVRRGAISKRFNMARWEILPVSKVRENISAEQVERALTRAESILGLPKIMPRAAEVSPWPKELILPEKKEGETLDLYDAQKAAEEKFCATLPEPQKEFTRNLGMLVNERDPITGYKASHMLPRNLDYLEDHSKQKLVLAELEISNLITLNDMFGIAGANRVMTSVMNQLMMPVLNKELNKDTPEDQPKPFNVARDVYYAGGSRIRLLLRDIPAEKVRNALTTLASEMQEHINNNNIQGFLDEYHLGDLKLNEKYDRYRSQNISSIPHPKKKQADVESGDYFPRDGVELFYAALDVDKDISSRKTINLLEALKESTEEQPEVIRQMAQDKQYFLRKDTNTWLAGNGITATGLVNGVPEKLYKIVIEQGHRLGRGQYHGLLVPGKIAMEGGDPGKFTKMVKEAPVSSQLGL